MTWLFITEELFINILLTCTIHCFYSTIHCLVPQQKENFPLDRLLSMYKIRTNVNHIPSKYPLWRFTRGYIQREKKKKFFISISIRKRVVDLWQRFERERTLYQYTDSIKVTLTSSLLDTMKTLTQNFVTSMCWCERKNNRPVPIWTSGRNCYVHSWYWCSTFSLHYFQWTYYLLNSLTSLTDG